MMQGGRDNGNGNVFARIMLVVRLSGRFGSNNFGRAVRKCQYE
jgi:hypothetical protein